MKWLTDWIGKRRAKLLSDVGNEHRRAGDLSAALTAYRSALLAFPAHTGALYNFATALRELGQADEAERTLRRLVELDPADGDGLFQLGELLLEAGRFSEAGRVLERAFAVSPRNALIGCYLGIARVRGGEPQRALEAFRQALEVEPDYPEVLLNLGNAYSMLDRHEEALDCYSRAYRAASGNSAFRGALLNEMQHCCAWTGIGEMIRLQRESIAQSSGEPIHPFHMMSIPTTRAEQLQCARSFAAHVMREAGAPLAPPAGPRRGAADGRIRIGYFSSDFHEHATAYLVAEMIELHDRRRFEVAAYSCGPQTGDPMQSRLRRGFDRFVDLRECANAAAAAAIRADGVDILVDLKGYTLDARTEIVALRPAPIQVSFLGYPVTMGAPFIDYFVVDRFVVPPGHERDYSEKLVFLPGCYQVNDRRRIAAPPAARQALGLPPEAFVFCVFQQSYKILPDMFAAWMRVLAAAPGSVLWLLESNAVAARNLRRAAEAAGVDAARLIFAPKLAQQAHLARLGAADLYLDTLPCNAHTTASDALWAGLPVLTCAGDTFAARVAGSLLHAIGLPELVTASLPEYEALARRLATAPDELRALRDRLRDNLGKTSLYDTPRFVRHLESAYERIWGLYQEGRPPQELVIAEQA
jgi:predicted O-linked N-acetylglucosamine transferase (SPINDLY family)